MKTGPRANDATYWTPPTKGRIHVMVLIVGFLGACSNGGDGADSPSASIADSETTVTVEATTTSSATESTTVVETTQASSTTAGEDPLGCTDEDGASRVGAGEYRGEGESRERCLDGAWVADPLLETETTLPTEQEFGAATIGSGTYAVGPELGIGLYRVAGSWEFLDDQRESLAGDAIDENAPGYSLMSVSVGVPFVEISGSAVPVEFLPVFDPLAEGAAQGTYLVGIDIQPGTYRISNPEGAYAARLGLSETSEWDIIEEVTDAASLTITVEWSDFAFTFRGDPELT